MNADAAHGDVRAEVLDPAGRVIAPFSLENCLSTRGDTTRVRVRWKGADDLGSIGGRPVRLRIQLRKASLYAFWVTPSVLGASYGYPAAGGPEFDGAVDTVGGK